MPLTPKDGAIAVCSDGHLGLVISDDRHNMGFPDGTMGLAYVGIHLGGAPKVDGKPTGHPEKQPGSPWASRNPRVLGYVGSIEDAFKAFSKGQKKTTWQDELKDLVDFRDMEPGWEADFVSAMADRLIAKGPFSDNMISKIHELWNRYFGGNRSFVS
jgi:hypothetical protein